MKAKRALSSLFATAACARHFTTLRSTPWTSRIDSHAIGAVTTDGWSSKPTFRTMLLTRGGADSSAASDDSIVPPLQDPENDESVLAVQRLGGWSAEEAKDALANANGNVQLAHANLAAAEEAELLATQAAGLAELTAKGYDAEVAANAMRESMNNVTEAGLALAADAAALAEQLEEAVTQMVAKGWPEDEARAHLLSQIESRKDKHTLATDGGVGNMSNDAKEGGSSSASSNHNATSSMPPLPTEEEMKALYFNVTEATFQDLVIDSPVPVLVDVHATWCGPCKALAPVLESVAQQARGSVRVAKLDAEACKALAHVLQIKAFPTVFTFKQGLATDSFVGIPPQEELQAFFLRAVGAPMGQDGKPVPPRKTSFDSDDPGKEHQHSDAALKAMSATAGRVAGLASIGFAKKESLEDSTADYMNQLETEVAVAAATAATAAPAAADSPDSAAAGAGSKEVPKVGAVASALSAYLGNLENDIRSEKFRQVPTSAKYYTKYIAPFPSAVAVLKSAGFKPNADGTMLVIKHRNLAAVSLVRDSVVRWASPGATMQRQRKAKAELFKKAAAAGDATGVAADDPTSGATGRDVAWSLPEGAEDANVKKAPAIAPPADGHCRVAVRVPARKKGGQDVALPPQDFDARKTTLAEFLTWVRQQPAAVRALYGASTSDPNTTNDRAPLRVVLRACGVDASEGGADSKAGKDVFATTLHDLGVKGEVAAMVSLAPLDAARESSKPDPFAKRQDKGKFADGGKVHTMLSTGVLKANTNKATEYENGDGTVYEAALDAQDDDEAKEADDDPKAAKGQDDEKEGTSDEEEEDEDEEEDSESGAETDKADALPSLSKDTKATSKVSDAADEGSLPPDEEEDDEEENDEEDDEEEKDDEDEEDEEDGEDEDGDDEGDYDDEDGDDDSDEDESDGTDSDSD